MKNYGKGAIFFFNKWDLIENPHEYYKKLLAEVKRKMWFMIYVPVITASATEKKRVTNIFPLVDEIINERKTRISTSDLNRYLDIMLKKMSLPLYKGKPVKIYYITQVKIEPPTFVFFTNYPSAFKRTTNTLYGKGFQGILPV